MLDVFLWFSVPTIVVAAVVYFLARKFGKPIPETEEERAYWQAIR